MPGARRQPPGAKSLQGGCKSRDGGLPRPPAVAGNADFLYIFAGQGEGSMTTEAELKAAADPQILSDLVLANRILYALGVLDGYGHVSARDPGHPEHFLLSRALAPALVKADDIMAYDLDSSPVEDRGCELYSERFIHGEVFRARGDVHAVVHSHSPTIIPFSISKTALCPVYHMASFIPPSVPVFEI